MLKLLPVVTCCCLHLNILAWLVLCSEHSLTEAASRRRISKSIESNQQVRNKCLRTICPDILAAPVSTQTHCLLDTSRSSIRVRLNQFWLSQSICCLLTVDTMQTCQQVRCL